ASALADADECEYLPPGIGRCVRVVLGLAIEEGVRGIRVDDDPVLNASVSQRPVVLVAYFRRDRLVRAAEDGEDRTCEARRQVGLCRSSRALLPTREAIEAD